MMPPITFEPATPFRSQRRCAADVLKGAVAGAAATWMMRQATTLLYDCESTQAREQENVARGQTTYAVAADRITKSAGVELTKRRKSRAATALHWTAGIGAGAVYAVARRRWPAVASASRLPFGAGCLLLADEAIDRSLGFPPPPRAFPWQTHARGVTRQIVFGMLTLVTLTWLDRVGRRRRRMEALLSMA